MPEVPARHEQQQSQATGTGGERAAGLADWLADLLDMALDRADTPLARLIADVVDDPGAAAAKG